MKSLLVLAAAQTDLVGIWHYSADLWGPDQADRYSAEIDQIFSRLAEGIIASQSAAAVRPGLRKVRSGGHIVSFFEDDHLVQVVRVLHERMDIETKL